MFWVGQIRLHSLDQPEPGTRPVNPDVLGTSGVARGGAMGALAPPEN